MKSLLLTLVAAAACFLLSYGAAAGSFERDRGVERDDSFGRADADRDGFIDWEEYRDFRRDGSRGDFARRDLDLDNRLSRDEWESFDTRNDRWPSRR